MVLAVNVGIMFVGLVTTEKESKGSFWDASEMCTFDLGADYIHYNHEYIILCSLG